MAMNRRHVEFFGPDLGRGPFSPNNPETAAVQIATALAQIRAPLSRSDNDLRDHIDFIRELADRLMPDWATHIRTDVGEWTAGSIQTSIRAPNGKYTLLNCWLADARGDGVTALAPTTVTWNQGIVIREFVTNKHYLILTPDTGVADVTVSYSGDHSWYWAVARHGRVFYSSALTFTV